MTSILLPTTLVTTSGGVLDLRSPDPDVICVRDIAHALALTARYGGHTSRPYSVAQHSVYVSRWADWGPRTALYGLLHDAAEAYIGDVTRPVRAAMYSTLDLLEADILHAIYARCGLPPPSESTQQIVADADHAVGRLEQRRLWSPELRPSELDAPSRPGVRLRTCWPWRLAEWMFGLRLIQLVGYTRARELWAPLDLERGEG